MPQAQKLSTRTYQIDVLLRSQNELSQWLATDLVKWDYSLSKILRQHENHTPRVGTLPTPRGHLVAAYKQKKSEYEDRLEEHNESLDVFKKAGPLARFFTRTMKADLDKKIDRAKKKIATFEGELKAMRVAKKIRAEMVRMEAEMETLRANKASTKNSAVNVAHTGVLLDALRRQGQRTLTLPVTSQDVAGRISLMFAASTAAQRALHRHTQTQNFVPSVVLSSVPSKPISGPSKVIGLAGDNFPPIASVG